MPNAHTYIYSIYTLHNRVCLCVDSVNDYFLVSRAFYYLPHYPIATKRNAYRFRFSATRLVQSYLLLAKKKDEQRVEFMGGNLFWFSAGFYVLGQLLFNIFMYDLFPIMNDVDFASYPGDDTPYLIGDGVVQFIESLKEASDEFFCCFANN